MKASRDRERAQIGFQDALIRSFCEVILLSVWVNFFRWSQAPGLDPEARNSKLSSPFQNSAAEEEHSN